MKRLSWSVVWGLCAVDLFKFDSAICPENESLTMNCGCTRAFLVFNGEYDEIFLLAKLFSHLSSLRMWKFLSGFGRTRCADTAAAFLGRPEFSKFRLLAQVCAFLRVKNIFHIRDRSLNMSSLVVSTFPSVLLSIIWFIGRITYCLFRPLPAPSSLALRRVLGGNRLAAVCSAERSDSECPSEFQSG